MSDKETDARLTQIDTALHRLDSAVDSVLAATNENAFAIMAVERALGGQLTTLAQAQDRVSAKLDGLRQDFTSFVEQDRRDKERLIAHTGLILVRAEIKTRFGHYEGVRRNVHGMLLALDAGLVLDATTQLIAEKQSIDAPSYWLASAQNALAAWTRNDRGAAERALLHARSCSRGKTALFFGLLNARYERFDATDKWFREYLNDQEPQKLSREFTVVLDAAMLGLLGNTTFERVIRTCHAWFESLCTPENVERQVARWQSEIARRCQPASGPDVGALNHQCQVLASVSPYWPRITNWYRDATAFGPMKDELSAHLHLSRSDESAWRPRIDAILHDLRTIHEPEESDLRRQEADLQRIVEYKGDTAAAGMAREAEAPADEPKVDLLTFLTNVALHPRRLDVSQQTTQFALYLAARWISAAAGNIARESRTRSAAPVTIEIDVWSGELGTEPVGVLAGSFSEVIESQTRREVARERFAWRRLVAALLAVAFLGSMTFELSKGGTVQLWRVIVPACLASVSLFLVVAAHRRIPKRTARAEQRGDKRKQDGLATLRTAESDREQMLAAWNERIREADRLQEFVRSIAVPEPRLGVPGQRSQTEGLLAGWGTELRAPSARSRGVDHPQPPLELPEWSLEPAGTDGR